MKKVLLVVGLAVVGVAFVGYGLARKGQSGPRYRIAVIPKGTASPFWETVHGGAAEAAAETGYEISWSGPEKENDRERQIQIVEDFIARKVDGIVLAPNDRKALVPIVEKIYAKKIPCVIIDSEIDTDKYASFVATDNYQGGVIAGERMGEILGGKGKVVVLQFVPGSGSTTNREEGFMNTIREKFPDIEIVDTKYGMETVETCLQAAEDMLTKHEDLDGMFASNNRTSMGVAQALKSQGRVGQVKVVGFDAEESLVKMLREGVIDSLVAQNPHRMGYDGVKTVVDVIEGRKVSKRIDTGVELITKQRLEEPKIKALLNPR